VKAADDVLSLLHSRRSGLTAEEAAQRLEKHGLNKLEAQKKPSPILLFLRQFLSPLIYVLLVAAVLSLFLSEYLDFAVIMGVLLLNALIGFIQEHQAARAMEALMRMAAPKAIVHRDNKVMSVPTEEIVPGDILLLESGARVPADARVIEEANLKVNEASLTGESTSVDKEDDPVDEDTALAERNNMVFLGTNVTHGRAMAVVVATGMNTELGGIASAIKEVKEERTPVEKSIAKLSRYIVIIVLGVTAILALIGIYRGLEPAEVVFLSVAAAVAAIPEGLPAVVTVVLAVGMRFMAKRNAIIRSLVAVETLGSATVICSDKTGTLTMNEMTVRRIYVDGEFIEVTGRGYEPIGEFRRGDEEITIEQGSTLELLLHTGALCNEASLVEQDQQYEVIGDPTDGALVVAAAKAGIDKAMEQSQLRRSCEIPFESERQYMAIGYESSGRARIYVKGSAEKILSLSKAMRNNGELMELREKERKDQLQAAETLASDAMRVLALAYIDLSDSPSKLKCSQVEGELTYLGMVGMADPPREEAKAAVRRCSDAGIRVVMITGDHKVTAEAIGRQLGLPEGKAIDGKELEESDDEQLDREIEHISVFARIEPKAKLRIVKALTSKGHVVAMTGDGVNDAPALKAASIGVAMGITDTDVAKEASDMVLTDDNFSSVVAAVEEGRAIFSRLRNVVFFLLSTGIGELVALTISVAVLGRAPLIAVQILWVNLVTATPSAIPLGLEPNVGDELDKPPRHPKVGLLFPGNFIRIAYMAALMGVGVFIVFNWAQSSMSIEKARTLAFCTMVTFEWFNAFVARSDEHTLRRIGPLKNRWLLVGISAAIILQLAVVYIPAAQLAFETEPLTLQEWAIPVAAGISLLLIEEIRKAIAPNLFSRGKWRPVKVQRPGRDT
ncbi:MAG: cation-translocating P-type ATPase, partial [Chloroflexota bacterium]